MYIKLNLQGELLQLLQDESKEEFRSPTQHVMFILNKHFKDKISSVKETSNVSNTQEVSIEYQKELLVTSGVYEDKIHSTEQPVIVTNTQEVVQQEQEDFDYISDEMINF